MLKTKGNTFLYLLAAVSIILSVSCQNVSKNKVLKLAHALPTDHPVHLAMEFMAKRTDELSEGKLKIEIYPSEQLGSEQQCVELIQIGSLGITKVSAAVMESFSDHYKVMGLPYLFNSKNHMFTVLDGDIGEQILNSTSDKWIRGLCFYDAGSRSFYTMKKPVLSPSDLNGLKIRVMKSKTAMDMVKAIGGSPTPIAYGELYTALQSGVVDGAENNPPSFVTSHHYEICKYYSLDEHTSVPDVMIISEVVWQALSFDEKSWLKQAVKESVALQRELWAKSEIESLEIVQKAGVEIFRPDKQPFREKVKDVYKKYEDDPIIYPYITRIQETIVPGDSIQ